MGSWLTESLLHKHRDSSLGRRIHIKPGCAPAASVLRVRRRQIAGSLPSQCSSEKFQDDSLALPCLLILINLLLTRSRVEEWVDWCRQALDSSLSSIQETDSQGHATPWYTHHQVQEVKRSCFCSLQHNVAHDFKFSGKESPNSHKSRYPSRPHPVIRVLVPGHHTLWSVYWFQACSHYLCSYSEAQHGLDSIS